MTVDEKDKKGAGGAADASGSNDTNGNEAGDEPRAIARNRKGALKKKNGK